MTFRIGIISDTHGLLRPEAERRLAGVDHIIHGGDIGRPEIIDALRRIAPVTAIRGKRGYQSMTSAESSDRTVCPHALVKASGRYHVRAFDFSRKRFVDFSLSRVLSSTPLADDPSVPSRLDDDWYAMIDVEFEPHPRLSSTQRMTTAREFGMHDGKKIIAVRRALLFYLLDEMRLLSAVRRLDESLADVPVWIRNARHVAAELTSMESES